MLTHICDAGCRYPSKYCTSCSILNNSFLVVSTWIKERAHIAYLLDIPIARGVPCISQHFNSGFGVSCYVRSKRRGQNQMNSSTICNRCLYGRNFVLFPSRHPLSGDQECPLSLSQQQHLPFTVNTRITQEFRSRHHQLGLSFWHFAILAFKYVSKGEGRYQRGPCNHQFWSVMQDSHSRMPSEHPTKRCLSGVPRARAGKVFVCKLFMRLVWRVPH